MHERATGFQRARARAPVLPICPAGDMRERMPVFATIRTRVHAMRLRRARQRARFGFSGCGAA